MVTQLQHLCSEQQSNWGLNLAACVTDEKKRYCPEETPCFQSSTQPPIMNPPADIRAVYLTLHVFRLSCIFKFFLHHLHQCADPTHTR